MLILKRLLATKCVSVISIVAAFLMSSSSAWAYGPLNHLCVANQNWDAAWDLIHAVDSKISPGDARQAYFAGAMADDLGYYPVPSPDVDTLKLLTDSMHYARTGEWVEIQLRDAAAKHDGVLFAFALGELSHYAVDRMGHYYGTNVVALQVAKTQDMYGPRMSYERDEPMHFVVESGFDFLAVSKGCSPDEVEEIAHSLPKGQAWESRAKVLEFLNEEYQKIFFGAKLDLKVEYFAQALLIADDLFARTAIEAEKLYGLQPQKPSILPDLIKGLEGVLKIPGSSDFSGWVKERVADGLKFAQSYGPSYSEAFGDSYNRANGLYASLLKELQTEDDKTPPDMSGLSFENINLDTDMLSASGEYSLADRTYEHILSHGAGNTKISCPPQNATSHFYSYFARGRYNRDFLLKLAWNLAPGPGLQDALDRFSQFFRHEHDVTGDDAIPLPNLLGVHFTKCDPDGPCLTHGNARVFLKDATVAVGPGIVNYTSQSALLDVWLAAMAASELTKGNINSAEVFHNVYQWRLEIIENYRLEDPANHDGYYAWPDFCSQPPRFGEAIPKLNISPESNKALHGK